MEYTANFVDSASDSAPDSASASDSHSDTNANTYSYITNTKIKNLKVSS